MFVDLKFYAINYIHFIFAAYEILLIQQSCLPTVYHLAALIEPISFFRRSSNVSLWLKFY